VHGNVSVVRPKPKKDQTKAMLQNYIFKVGDFQPDKHEVHMPVCIKSKQLLQIFEVISVLVAYCDVWREC
jgi:hypothetical protein